MTGFALCGSFCNMENALFQLKSIIDSGEEVVPIVSYNVFNTDTRFGKASDIIEKIEKLCQKKVICPLQDAEPLGPRIKLDVLCVCPCTGNTLAKLSTGVADTCVTLAAKAHIRNERPLLIAVSTNDALSVAAANIGRLLNNKNIYFVPMKQDDCIKKPRSIVADFDKTYDAIICALNNIQIQPIFT